MSLGSSISTSLQHTTNMPYDSTIHHRGTSQRCCETGRPVAADPVTGSIICSCQFQHNTQTYLSRVPSLPEHIYGSMQNQIPSAYQGMGQPAFYSMEGLSTDRRTEGFTVPASGQVPFHYDQLMTAYPYGALPAGFDFNAARRKNATRETTGPLKAWLNAHRKNPYPTKGEKVMLAIITRMTLTQVSTWFANARRRLKKDNVFGDDDSEQDDKLSSKDDSISSQNSLSEDDKRPVSDTSGISDVSDVDIEVDDVTSRRKPAKKCVQRLFSPDIRTDIAIERIPSPEFTHIPSESEDTSRVSLQSLPHDNTKSKTDSLLSFESLTAFRSIENQKCSTDTEKYDSVTRKESTKRKRDSDSDVTTVSAAKKPKIWSISEIIG